LPLPKALFHQVLNHHGIEVEWFVAWSDLIDSGVIIVKGERSNKKSGNIQKVTNKEKEE
jgi:hypothetical protein